jgi:RHS repeat-associated protein
MSTKIQASPSWIAFAAFACWSAAALGSSVELQTAPLVTPTSAWTFYGSATTHTTGVAAPTTTPAEITELARALGSGRYTNDAYALTVYEYIRNNIETEFRFGLSKGARGALIDQSGTPFDQANLMVALLRAGGITATYKVGTISLSAAQFQAWTGLANPATGLVNTVTACQFLADGAIPATVTGSSTCTGLTGTLPATGTPVVMAHIWVLANGQIYDPAYKIHIIKTGVDIAAQMSCGTASAPTCGTTVLANVPAAQTLVAGVSYVPGTALTQTNIETQLKTYATNLQHYIQSTNVANRSTSNPNMQVEDLIGGAVIDISQSLPAQTANPVSQLPLAAYQTTPQYSWTGDIPDKFRTTLLVQFDNFNGGAGQLLYADEIAGNRLRIWGATVSGSSLIRNVTLYSEYRPLVTSSVANTTDAPVSLLLTVQHPYAANSGAYASEVLNFNPKMQTGGLIGVLSIVAGWGDSSENTVNHFAALQKRDMSAMYPENPSDPKHIWLRSVEVQIMPFQCIATTTSDPLQLPGFDTGCFEAHQPIIAANWLAQTSRGAKLAGQVNGVVIQNHHSLGLILSGTSISPSTFLDLETTVSANSRVTSASDRTAALAGVAAVKGRLEGSVLEQTFDSTEGGDGISMIGLANGLSTKLLQVTASNFTAASTQLTNYSAASITHLQSLAVTSGYTLIVPQNGTTARSCLLNPPPCNYRYAGIAAYGTNQIKYLSEGAFINGAIGEDGGGGGAASGDPSVSAIAATKTLEYSIKGRERYGVNLANGDLKLTPPPDLATGSGEFPYSLSFQRFYSANNISTDPALSVHGIVDSGGWTNSLEIYAKIGSDTMAGLGRDAALNAAGAIAALYVQRTLNTGTMDIRSNLATIFTTHWLGENLYDNVVSVVRPPKSSVFVKLPDSTFNPEPGSAELLTQVGSRAPEVYLWGNIQYDSSSIVFTLTDKAGSVLTLPEHTSPGQETAENFFMPSTWTFKNGVVLTFSYPTSATTCSACLSSVSNNLGRSLTLTNQGGSSFTVQDQAGRSVIHNYTPTVWGVASTMTVTGPDLGVTTYNYVANPGFAVNRNWNKVANWITPLGGTPYLTVGYDSLYRVNSLTDNTSPQNTTNYFVSVLYGRENQKRGEEMQPQGLLASAPLTTKYFDLNSLQLQNIDALGRITSSLYDTNHNLIKTTYPELNADVFTYDVRSNRLSTTHIPKPGSLLSTPPPELVTYVEGPTVTACAFPASCNQVASTTDANGNVTTYTYLGQNTAAGTGQVQRTVGPAVVAQSGGVSGSAQTDYCYSNVTGALSLLAASIQKIDSTTNRVKSFTYNTLANYFALLTATSDPITTYVPPVSAGGVCTTSAKTGALALTTTFAFDAAGNPHTIDGPIPGTSDQTTYTFDSMRRLTTVAAPLSVFTRHCYDADGELLSTNRWKATSAPSDPNSGTAATTGQCATAFSPSSWQSDIKTYFPTGDLKTSADAESNTTTYAYDPMGRQQVIQDPDGRQIAKVFDLAGEVIAEWHGGSGWLNASGAPSGTWPSSWIPSNYAGTGPVRYESFCSGTDCYSGNGKPHYAIDANGDATRYVYDGLDRLQFTLFPNAANGTLCGLPSSDNGTALPSCVLSGGTTPTFEQSFFDSAGNRTKLVTRKGDAINYHFDALNRQDIKSPASQGAVTTGFNLAGEPLNIAKALLGANPAHTTTYTYDATGRALTEKNDTLTVTHQFDTLVSTNDNAGNRTRTTWPDGYFVTYKYDALNRMVDVRENSTSTNELAFYAYDALSRRSSVCMGAYTTASCQTGTWNNKAAYGYEADGQLNSVTQTLNGTTVSLGYGRNHSYQINGLTASDAFYLPTPAGASSTAYVPNALNQYGSVGGQQSSYDTNGNLLTWFPLGGKHTYTYDSENRLTTAAVNGSATATISYDYDGLGRRMSKTVSGVSTKYLLDGDEEIAEYSGATVLRHYIIGPGVDDRIAHAEGSAIANPTKTYYHVNHQGSVMAMTDGSGNVTQRIGYDEYGNGSPTTGEQFGYTGRRFDPETGLYYYRGRYYSPQLGRFLQTDPVGSGGVNSYTYGDGDPANKVDPTGETTWCTGHFAGETLVYISPPCWDDDLGDLPFLAAMAAIARSSANGVQNTLQTGSRSATPNGDCEEHHICTDKNSKSDRNGGPWTPRFKELFRKANMKLSDADNKVILEGHYGPHPEEYHQIVYDRLAGSTRGLTEGTPEYTAAFRSMLQSIKQELQNPSSFLNNLVTK